MSKPGILYTVFVGGQALALSDILNFIPNHIDNPIGLWAFLALIPLIILYILRPRPLEKMVPALMFFFKEKGKIQKYSFFRRFIRDLLFILQLLVIIMLALSVAEPFYKTKQRVSADETVLVLDMSASMNTGDRFKTMLSEAKKSVSGTTTIILAGNAPEMVLKKGDEKDARYVLDRLRKTDEISSVGDAIVLASDFLEGDNGQIVVISDFIQTHGIDPFVAKKSLEAKKMRVEFVDVAKAASNIGIVDLGITDEEIVVSVKNYNDEARTARFDVNDVALELETTPSGTHRFTFVPQSGINKVELTNRDDLASDNVAYIFKPEEEELKLMLITNKDDSHLESLFTAYKEIINPSSQVDIAKPPILPFIEHDVIAIDGANFKSLPSAVFNQIERQVKEGATLIITADNDRSDINNIKMLPFKLGKSISKEMEVDNTFALPKVTENVVFRKVERYYEADPSNETTTIARTRDGNAVITLSKSGLGTVVYYGIPDDKSSFNNDISYPILWRQIIEETAGAGSIEDYNEKIDKVIRFSEKVTVQHPEGEERELVKTDEVTFDTVGIYYINERPFAVNLIDEIESDVNAGLAGEEDSGDKIDTGINKPKKKDVTVYVIALGILFMFLEILFIKFRGDL